MRGHPTRVICLGDSCTYGQGLRASEAWPAVLEGMTGHDVRNAGVCGDTTRLGLERFQRDVGMHKPDVVVIQFGHNDANEWYGCPRVTTDAFRANVIELRTRTLMIEARPLVLWPHPTRKTARYDWRVSERREAIRAVSIGLATAGLLEDGYGVHPDGPMHRRYATLVAEAL